MDIQSPFCWDADWGYSRDPEHSGLVSLVIRHAADHDDSQIALTDLETGLSWRYQDLNPIVTRCAQKLCAIGANSGAARLALVSAHTARVLFLQMAAVDVGCTVACINAGLNPEEIWQQMEAIECTHCVIESQFAYKIDEFRRRNATKGVNRCRITKTLEEFFDESKGKELNRRSTHYTIGDSSIQENNLKNGIHGYDGKKCHAPVFIFFSYGMSPSGKTTGATARPICVAPATLSANLRRFCAPELWRSVPNQSPDSNSSSATLLAVNVHSLFGTLCAYATLFQRRNGYVLSKFSGKSFASTVLSEKISTAFITVAMAHIVASMSATELQEISPLRRLIVGGVRFDGGEPTRLCAAKLSNVDIRRAYVTTEIGGICAISPPNCNAHNSVGVPLPDLIARIVRLNDDTQRCKAGESGALLFRVDSPMPIQIFRDAEATERLYLKSTDGITFLRTGDVASYDSNGYIFVLDKIVDLIRWNQITVIPSHVETALRRHDGISDCAIVQCDDQPIGNPVISLFIVRDVNRRSIVSHEVDVKEVRQFLTGIPEAHLLSNCTYNIHFVTEIARSAGGRILRRRLRQFIERERVNLFNADTCLWRLKHNTRSVVINTGYCHQYLLGCEDRINKNYLLRNNRIRSGILRRTEQQSIVSAQYSKTLPSLVSSKSGRRHSANALSEMNHLLC